MGGVIGIVDLLSMGSIQPLTVPRRTGFSTLRVGQCITLKDRDYLYKICTMGEAAPLTRKVVEIGDDYFVIRDDAEVVASRIPTTAERAVIQISTKPK